MLRSRKRKNSSRRPDRERVAACAHLRVARALAEPRRVAYIRQRLAMTLGTFAQAVLRVSVRIGDVNGWRGGPDTVCRIKAVLRGLPSVVVERRDTAVQAAIDNALDATAQAVRRAVQRRRTWPIQRMIRAR
jgi:hypothetical protein